MGRIRTIKPEFPQSESIGRLSRDARLLFLQLWTLVDDAGRTRGTSRILASLLYPYDVDVPALIGGWLDELQAEGHITRYESEGHTYLQVCNWLSHQKIDHASASKFPAPDESSRILANPRESFPRTKEGTKDQGEDQGPRTAAKREASQFDLPTWVSSDTWRDFEEMRKKIRKPLTDRARRNIVLELDRMRLQGQDSEAVLSQSITNSWSGVFELKGGANGKTEIGNSAPSVTKQRVDRNLAAIDKALERRGLSATDFDRQADGAELPGTGLERVLRGLPVGLRAVMPAVQHDPRDVGAGRVENPAGPEILPPAA